MFYLCIEQQAAGRIIFTVCSQWRARVKWSWWRHQMETFSSLLAFCEGNPPVNCGFPHKGQWRGDFDVSFDLRLEKRLSKQSKRQWFETPSRPLWRHCNDSLWCDCLWWWTAIYKCFQRWYRNHHIETWICTNCRTWLAAFPNRTYTYIDWLVIPPF